MVRLDFNSVFDIQDMHLCVPSQKRVHRANMLRSQMLNHNKRHPAIRGHVPEKSIERLQPARRRSYANNKRCSLFSSRPVFRRTRRLFSPETFFSPTCFSLPSSRLYLVCLLRHSLPIASRLPASNCLSMYSIPAGQTKRFSLAAPPHLSHAK